MTLRYASIASPTVRAAYEAAIGKTNTKKLFVVPVGRAALPDRLEWIRSEMLKTRVAHGYCSRDLAANACPYSNICAHAFAQAKPSIAVISPGNGDTVTTTDIPVRVRVSNFTVSASAVGMPDKEGEGHIHVMLDGMNMGVLFNFYTSPTFTLPGQGMKPGQHTLTFDLASNTHEDMEDTVTNVTINYQPLTAQPAPQASPSVGTPEVSIIWPPDGATVGPLFTLQVTKTNFAPSLELEGKPNLAGYGHYHLFVDMPMMDMTGGGGGQDMGGMMSMAGMIAMVGNDNIPVDLRAWSNGQHTITVEPVQNDHTPIQGAKEAMITITLQGAAQAQAPEDQ